MTAVLEVLRTIRDRLRIQKNRIIKRKNISDDPYEQVSVKPTEITEWSRRPLPNHRGVIQLCGSVQAGDWDMRDSFEISSKYDRRYYLDVVYNDVNISNTIFYKSMENHFNNDVEWEKTEYFQKMYNILQEEGSVVWSGERSSKQELLERCNEVDALYDSMAKQGYCTQKQLGRNRKNQLANEILVDIGRDGNYLLVDGKHRLVIAKLLNIDVIIATVLVRHEEWIESKACST